MGFQYILHSSHVSTSVICISKWYAFLARLGWRRGSSFSRFKTTCSELLDPSCSPCFGTVGAFCCSSAPCLRQEAAALLPLLTHSVYLSLFCPAGPGHLHQRKLRWHMWGHLVSFGYFLLHLPLLVYCVPFWGDGGNGARLWGWVGVFLLLCSCFLIQ